MWESQAPARGRRAGATGSSGLSGAPPARPARAVAPHTEGDWPVGLIGFGGFLEIDFKILVGLQTTNFLAPPAPAQTAPAMGATEGG